MGRGSFPDLCPVFELSVVDFPNECNAACIVLGCIHIDWGYKRMTTDPVRGILIYLSYVLLSIERNQGEEAATHIVSILQFAAFDVEVFRLYVRMQQTLTTSVSNYWMSK